MPEVLKKFFADLPPKDSREIWNFLNGNPKAYHALLELARVNALKGN